MEFIKFASRLILFISICLFLKSCKNSELSGIYKGQDSIELELRNNSYQFYTYLPSNNSNTDAFLIIEKSILKGPYSIKKDKLILYDTVNHQKYYLKIVNDEILISNSKFLTYKCNDTLYCKRKFYSDGEVEWVEGKFNEKLNIRIYDDHKGYMTKKVYYDRKRNIVKVEKRQKDGRFE